MKNIFWNDDAHTVNVLGFSALMLGAAVAVLAVTVIIGHQTSYDGRKAACSSYSGYATRWFDHGYLDYGCQVKAMNGQWENLSVE